MKPLVERLEQEYGDDIEFRLINVERDPSGADIARSLGVQFVPTFIFATEQGVVSKQLSGEVSEQVMREQLEALRR